MHDNWSRVAPIWSEGKDRFRANDLGVGQGAVDLASNNQAVS